MSQIRELLFAEETPAALRRGLDQGALRHRVIAHNLANAETPGFVPQRLEFREVLRRTLNGVPHPSSPVPGTTDPRHIPLGEMGDGDTLGGTLQPAPQQGIEETMVDLVENSFLYQADAELLAKYFQQLRTSIRGKTP